LTYAKWKDADADWLNDGATHMKEFDAKRKEFKVSLDKLIEHTIILIKIRALLISEISLYQTHKIIYLSVFESLVESDQ
jgi:hypothetical protein